ncbi:SDR family oxidoreductase [Alienimonas californiensis]|uniref:(-)-trans-carveol dehydrogenase n=1 Tax=Alienimonas californiensis TaxID=2527989 RepID=A0A517P580_9PLAN|nr:SDR family NAD(P)-dependent oxidoreductase [Alienimonas californiensis]QDT14524.1 (-)-trans-carveol dehydrogenase [Alienimonas californiensis]
MPSAAPVVPLVTLEGRVALITGAGSGLGRASAKRLATAGAFVGLLDLDADGLAETAEEIEAAGGRCATRTADVSDPESIRPAIEGLAEAAGRLDVVYANAGINGVWAPLADLEPDEWDQTLAVNLKGTFLTVKYALPWLKKRGGSVVVCASVNGTRVFSNTGATAYSCSKAGQLAFVKMVALELASHHIRVNAIIPGAIMTPIFNKTVERNIESEKPHVEYTDGRIPLTGGDPGDPRDVANAVLYLASDLSSHVTGAEIVVDGGESLLQG